VPIISVYQTSLHAKEGLEIDTPGFLGR